MTIKLIILGLVIGSNNLAASLALGAMGAGKHRWRIASIFAFFEFFIPLLGIRLGSSSAHLIQNYVSWLGPGLIVILGMWTVLTGFQGNLESAKSAEYITSWRGLILLGAGLSADNLVVGFSLGLVNTDPLPVAATIMIFSVIFTFIGIALGEGSRKRWDKTAEISSGILLVLFGLASAAGWL